MHWSLRGTQWTAGALGGSGAGARWEAGGPGLDKALLTARDPILFYQEAVLYEDELDDNGVSVASVKVRVMPSCWLVLFRFWLRVDHVLLRLRETRLMAIFGGGGVTPRVVREVSEREQTWEEMVAQGRSPNPILYRDADEVAQWLPLTAKTLEQATLSSEEEVVAGAAADVEGAMS